MKVTVEFLKDFATRKKGEKQPYDGMVASSLIKEKVAKLVKEKSSKVEK